MHIQTLNLTNYRGAKYLPLQLDEKLNVFAGVNGAGKSTVLDGAATMLSWAVSRIRNPGTSGRPISEDDITNLQSSASIELVCADGSQSIQWRLSKSLKGRGSPAQPSRLTELNDYAKTLQAKIAASEETVNIPIFIHYPVNRAVLDIPLRIRGNKTFDLLSAYDNALTSGANFRAFFAWFREREDLENENRLNNSTESDLPDPQLEAVRNALHQLLPEFQNLTVRRHPLRMEIEKDGELLKVNQLSDGEKCLIAMVSDMARRLAIANPQGNPLLGKGIILIDEIDLHLHPKWQQMIVPQLLQVFSNCQFIFSTHSPHVLTHIKPENIFLLKQTEGQITVDQPSESYGKNVVRILEDLMELDTTRPSKVNSKLHEIYEMLEQNRLEEAKQAIRKMKKQIGDDPDLVRATVLIRRKEVIGK